LIYFSGQICPSGVDVVRHPMTSDKTDNSSMLTVDNSCRKSFYTPYSL